MKVKDVIKILRTFNPEAEVVKPVDEEAWWNDPYTSIRNGKCLIGPNTKEEVECVILS